MFHVKHFERYPRRPTRTSVSRETLAPDGRLAEPARIAHRDGQLAEPAQCAATADAIRASRHPAGTTCVSRCPADGWRNPRGLLLATGSVAGPEPSASRDRLGGGAGTIRVLRPPAGAACVSRRAIDEAAYSASRSVQQAGGRGVTMRGGTRAACVSRRARWRGRHHPRLAEPGRQMTEPTRPASHGV